MSEDINWLFDDEETKAEPSPVVKYTPPTAVASSSPFSAVVGALTYIAIGAAVCFLLLSIERRDGGDDRVVIDEKGKFVLLLADETDEGEDRLTRDQAAALNSADTLSTAKKEGFEVRQKDSNKSLDGEDPVWRKLKEVAKEPPSITFSVDGDVVSKTIVDLQSTLELIKEYGSE